MAFLFKPFKTNVESYKQLQVKSTYHTEAEEHCTSRGGLQQKKKERKADPQVVRKLATTPHYYCWYLPPPDVFV